ncbi:MAG: hypothetical protein COB90_10325 [Hyphomicrobiales bacterium]|nr:MAG: hypothetical protein COB90_10325 [Hyphomicrobiales bacterium]
MDRETEKGWGWVVKWTNAGRAEMRQLAEFKWSDISGQSASECRLSLDNIKGQFGGRKGECVLVCMWLRMFFRIDKSS